MGKYFSDVVDKAIEDLYYCCDNDKATAAADALLLAAKEDDGDACYILSRCFSGSCYSWEYHPFEENEAAAYAMLHQAISLGSAAAVLGALRMDMLTPELREIMPFDSIKEAWDVIYEKAENGCAFCQYMIGNTYYFLDIIEIEDQKESNFANREVWNEWKRLQIKQCLPWFEKAFSGGMILAGRNYGHYYQYGRGEYIPAEPEGIKYDLLGICYLLGHGCRQDPARGKALLERSEKSCYKSYGLGMMYAEGIGVREDIEKGVEYLKAAGNYEPAMEALKHYKKSLFGVWRRK